VWRGDQATGFRLIKFSNSRIASTRKIGEAGFGMIRRDYLLRMIEEFIQRLARLQSLKQGQRWNEAGELLDDEFRRLVGEGAPAVARFSETDLLARLAQEGPTQLVREKTLLLTTLLKEAGDLATAEGREQESRDCYLKALHLLLDVLDLASSLVRGFNRPAEAREALAKAEALEITGLGKAYVPFVRGIIAWRERNFTDARKHLAEALTGLQPLSHHDLVVGLILLTKSYLCAVHRASGNLTEARKLFAETKQFLTAHREEELLRACRGGY
jgi:tetratricopeptide (TPR) repeat protein